MSTHPVKVSSYIGKFNSALGSVPLGGVDLEALEQLEHSPELDPYLDPAAPKILYTLVQTHIKRKPGYAIFNDRYGLLCVKILIRMVHVIACAHTDTLEYFKDTMDTEFTATNILGLLSNHTAALIMGHRESTENLQAVTVLLEKTRGLFSHDALADLLDILWRDRKQFFVLCRNGSLSGVSLLFYMLWEQLNSLGVMKDRKLVSHLRDLVLRYYLVTSSEDQRIAMRFLCIHMYKACKLHEEESKPCDPTDSLAIIRAYNQSLAFIKVDLDPQSGIKLDIYRYLLEFTSDLSAVSSTDEELPLIAKTAIERLWMAFDYEKTEYVTPPGNPNSQVMYYMGDVVYALSKLLGRIKAPRKPPREILEGLAQGGWPDILARYMFLNFRTPVFLEFPTYSLRQLPALCTSVSGFLPISHDVFADTHCDWLKVVSHLRLLQGLRPRGDTTISYVLEASEAWARWGNAIGFVGLERGPRGEVALDLGAVFYKVDCTNPRCMGGLSTRVCGRCGVARYCSLKCQNDDWTSSFPDSHRKRCEAKSDRSN